MRMCRYRGELSQDTTTLYRGISSRVDNEHVTHGIGRFLMKLRSMSATVENVPAITLQLRSGEIVNLENATVLYSYDSMVAVYCKMRVYLLPRYDYSVTTWKHVHAFVQDYCDFCRDMPARDMRLAAEHEYNNGEYMFANGWVNTRTNKVWAF